VSILKGEFGMQVVLHVAMDEINQELIELLKTLLSHNAEIIIRNDVVQLEEYDRSISVEQVMQEFSQLDYSPEFLADLEQGLKTSSVYAK
jgi:hypothetical protein